MSQDRDTSPSTNVIWREPTEPERAYSVGVLNGRQPVSVCELAKGGVAVCLYQADGKFIALWLESPGHYLSYVGWWELTDDLDHNKILAVKAREALGEDSTNKGWDSLEKAQGAVQQAIEAARTEERRLGRRPTRQEVGDFYKILGVEPFADSPAISLAYQRLTARYANHRDRLDRLTDAYNVLIGSNRFLYDIWRSEAIDPSDDIENMLRNFVTAWGTGRRWCISYPRGWETLRGVSSDILPMYSDLSHVETVHLRPESPDLCILGQPLRITLTVERHEGRGREKSGLLGRLTQPQGALESWSRFVLNHFEHWMRESSTLLGCEMVSVTRVSGRTPIPAFYAQWVPSRSSPATRGSYRSQIHAVWRNDGYIVTCKADPTPEILAYVKPLIVGLLNSFQVGMYR